MQSLGTLSQDRNITRLTGLTSTIACFQYLRANVGTLHPSGSPTDASGIRTSYSRRCEQGDGYTIIAVLEVNKQIPVYNVNTPLYSTRHEHNSLLQ
jgi:hypothetical protein